MDDHVRTVRQHLLKHLGKPLGVSRLQRTREDGSTRTIEVAAFAPSGPNGPNVYATCGASETKLANGARVEAAFMIRPAPSTEGQVAMLKVLGAFVGRLEREDSKLAIGDLLPAGPALDFFGPMDVVLLVPPVTLPPTFRSLVRSDRERVDVLWLLPVFRQEAAYAAQHGPQALMAVFAAHGFDLTFGTRKPANTRLSPEEAKRMAVEELEKKRKGSAGSVLKIHEDSDGVVLMIKKPKPKTGPSRILARFKAPEAEEEEEPAPGPRRPVMNRRLAMALNPPKKNAEQRFDLSQGRTAGGRGEVAPTDTPRAKRKTAREQLEAKTRRLEQMKAAARARLGKGDEDKQD